MSQPSSPQSQPRESAVSRKTNGLPALGRAIMAAKRGNHSFVMMSLDAAMEVHAVTKRIHKLNYQKEYQRSYRKVLRQRANMK
jgi:hypothetical protein